MASFPGGASGKNPPANTGAVGDTGQSLSQEDPLEEEMATHSSILTWKIPWTEEPGGLQSIGLDTSEATLHTCLHMLLCVIHLKRSCKAYM